MCGKEKRMMKKYLIETYGCQMNTAESNAIEILLKGRGLESTDNPDEADAVIINTCSVRKTAENRIWGRLGFYSAIKKKRPLKIVVTGCMASRLREEFKKDAPFVDFVATNEDKDKIASYLAGEEEERDDKYSFLSSYYKEGEFSSYIPIMNGCNNFCSYCIVPYVRGREVSRDTASIIEEVKFLESKGVREITLLGQNVNSYSSTYNGRDIDFPTLLDLIVPLLDNIHFVRFESPHPKDFSDHLIETIRDNKRICSHIHLPMQSGSSRILELMNRHTTREKFIELVEKMYATIPSLTLSTDVIVGFPTETVEEYEETLSMMEIMHPSEAFMYYYNPREGTRAEKMDGQIDIKTKTERLEKLIEKQLERQRVIRENSLPLERECLITSSSRDDESRFLCRDEHNFYYSVKPNKTHKIGDIICVKATTLSGNTFRGDEID